MNLSETTVVKQGGLFLVTPHDGAMPITGEHPLGLYLDDCRHLSGHALRIAGAVPELLVAAAPSGRRAIHELAAGDVRVRVEREAAPDRLRETLTLQLYGGAGGEVEVELTLAADFRPMMAIRGFVELPAPVVTCAPVERGLRFAAVTADGIERTTTVVSSREPSATGDGTLRFTLALRPGSEERLELEYRPAPSESGGSPATSPPAGARVDTDDELTTRILHRSLDDLDTLRTPLDGDTYYAAGVPWYVALFGRDSLITATEVLGVAPEVAAQTLRALARRIGRRVDPRREEEPGKILHELRVGEVANLGLTPLTRYYGTVDATPLLLCLLADHADWGGDLALFRELRPEVEAALGWLETSGDHDGDGLLDYRAQAPEGLRNQGWKDSPDGVPDEQGVPLEPPIALVEPQGYAIRGLRGVAGLYERDGDHGAAAELRARADRLADRLERFWLEDRRCYAMGLDGEGRPSRALASNQGHLLWAQAVCGERAQAIRDALMGDGLFSGWGIRTLGAAEAGYDPLSYHRGSVWPHDTAMCAAGLRACGFDADFATVLEALLDAASLLDGYRLPELFGGFARTAGEPPVPYPVACRPQAWAAGAIPYLLLAGLGLEAGGLDRRLIVRRPWLPRWVDRLTVSGLAVAGAQIDLRFERSAAGADVDLADVAIRGDVEVVVER